MATEEGNSLIGSLTGVSALVVLLLFAAQALYNLYTTSVVTAAAFDAARTVAQAGGDPASIEQAEAHSQEVLGSYSERVRFGWSVDDQVVRVHVHADNRNALFVGLHLDALEQVDRTVRVRVECFRDERQSASDGTESPRGKECR